MVVREGGCFNRDPHPKNTADFCSNVQGRHLQYIYSTSRLSISRWLIIVLVIIVILGSKYLKGEGNIFLRVLKIKSGLFVWDLTGVSPYLASLLWRKLKLKFLHASMKLLTYSENPFRNPPGRLFRLSGSRLLLQKLFRKLHVILKHVPKAGFDMYSGENQPMIEKESLERNSDAAFRTIFRIIVSVFKETCRNFKN